MIEKPILKHRYLLTQTGNIRLRYVVITACICVLALWGTLTTNTTPSQALVHQTVDVQDKVIALESVTRIREADAVVSDDPEVPGRGLGPYYTILGHKPTFNTPIVMNKTLTVEKGSTLGEVMEKTGLSGDAYFSAMKAIQKHIDPRDLKPGQVVKAEVEIFQNKQTIKSIIYELSSLKSVSLSPNEAGLYTAQKIERPVEVKTYAATTTIDNSIYADLGAQDVPDGIINRLIKAYSWSVDFQRDIWGGEEIEVLYETKETDDGSYVRSNRLLYAKLKLRNKEMPIYLFEKEEGYFNYFDPTGQSIKRALLRTPLDGGRISSKYGMRKHPVLGYNKMHKGVDFAAPTGTPIYAAGDGTVERASRFGAYGHYIRIRHNNSFKTAYAHLSRYAKGIKAGKRVKQGQVIGYVGSTGRSTGPHLHYEVIKAGRQVNPHSVDLPIGEKLKGNKLAEFKRLIKDYDRQYASLVKNNKKMAALSSDGESANN